MNYNELLDNSIKLPALQPVTSASLFVAMDIGSTGTRSKVFTDAGAVSSSILEPSDYAVINRDISYVTSKSSHIRDNMLLRIADVTEPAKLEPMFDDVTIAKGTLLKTLRIPAACTTATVSKIDQPTTYINAVTNIALDVLANAMYLGEFPGLANIDLQVSLPAEDTISASRIDLFKTRLAGRYTVEFLRLGVVVQFNLEASHVHVMAESNAVAVCHAMTRASDIDDVTAIGFIDVGGRSTGISFVVEGVLLEDGCITEPFGGASMCADIAKLVAEQRNIQRPSVEMVGESLDTGYMRFGAQRISITNSIDDAKQRIADGVFRGFMRALDLNQLQAQQLAVVYCSGRAMGESKEGDLVTSASMMNYIEKQFQKASPGTQFIRITEDEPIVTGLVYARFKGILDEKAQA